jgi:PPOX class probable F420-dependent enzyme
MLDERTRSGARVAARLRDELIIWLTTVTPGGQPQTSPVWFLWQGGELLVYSRGNTPRVANLASNPLVAASLDGDGEGGDIVSLEGEARIVTLQTPVADVPAAYIEKYARKLAGHGWTMESMLRDYPVTIWIRPTRIRAW